ncbi:MAG: TldD/PmbA family protein [Deltaproteobacteria bacterium]|nr:TldD/PmbA family protein [Deltaproteobacteria bacterium]
MRKHDGSCTRREFLARSAAGASLVIVPGFLSGCVKKGTVTGPVEPASVGAGYFGQFGIDEALMKKVIDRAMSGGGNYADLFFQHRIENWVVLEDGQVNRAYTSVGLGCGVRVLSGDQTGFAFTEELTAESLLAAAGTAAAVASGPAAPPMESVHRISPEVYYTADVPFSEVGLDRKIPLLERLNERAFGHDERIVKVRANMNDSTTRVLVFSSEGEMVEDDQPMAMVSCACVAEDGVRREENWYSLSRRAGFEFYDEAMMDELADQAATRTMVLFEASPPPPGECPVVLAPGLSGILLHEAIGHGMEADFNRKGISVYADRIGERIAPKSVTIVDDGTNPAERGSLNIDDEGRETRRTVLVEAGILRSYMHDRISAGHYGVAPTASGRRESYRYPPVPRMRNTYMLDGPHDPGEIISSVKKGIYAETFTNGQVKIGSGDFSFYLKNGRLIEDGKLTTPVKDANLIGFGPEVLEKVQMVGNDMAMYSGAGYCGKDGQRVPVGFGLPTTKCGGISVGGVK